MLNPFYGSLIRGLKDGVRIWFISWHKMFDFKSRSSRLELLMFVPSAFMFWMFITLVMSVLIYVVYGIFKIPDGSSTAFATFAKAAPLIGIAIAGFSLTVRRLHDFNRGGIWAVLFWVGVFVTDEMTDFAPPFQFMTLIIALCMLFIAGTKGSNRYGEPASI